MTTTLWWYEKSQNHSVDRGINKNDERAGFSVGVDALLEKELPKIIKFTISGNISHVTVGHFLTGFDLRHHTHIISGK